MPSSNVFPTGITEAMVYTAIADVLDPELDESLVKLGFIDSVQINDRDIIVAFKLPTYWCAPNFAYLMAADLRNRVQTIPGVRSVRILLLDHCTDEEVSTGVNTGKSFTEAFPDEAEDNLEELRLIFLRKGFLVRQDTLLRQLQKAGVDETTLLSLCVADLVIDEATKRVTVTTPLQIVQLERAAHTAQAYLRRAAALGIHHGPEDKLFLDDHGQPIPCGGLQAYLRQSRSVRMNIMFNTVFCTDMFQTRYGPGAHKTLPEGERT
jgi:metal-sulfur cluster biosynthetic enzyme